MLLIYFASIFGQLVMWSSKSLKLKYYRDTYNILLEDKLPTKTS